jgi:hypothetical protein
MAGSNQLHERCVCGAEITITENYSFISSSEIQRKFEQWQRKHKNCLILFCQIQQVRMMQLERGSKIKLLKD